jgi:hypothetical protein
MQSEPITTKVVSLNPAHDEVYSIQHYVIKFVSDCDRSTTAPPLQKTSVDCHGYVVNDKNEMDLNHNYDNLTEKVDNVSLNPAHDEVYSIQHYVIKFVSDCDRSVVFSGYSGFLHHRNSFKR